jgi:hypothetical protein
MRTTSNKRFELDAKTSAFLCYSLRSNISTKHSGLGAVEAGVSFHGEFCAKSD